jgi:surface carbohydrate biosynthesis protein
MPSLYHDQEVLDIVYYIAGNVWQIIGICWEQLYSTSVENNPNFYVYPKGFARNALFCCWGEKYKDLLIRAGVDKNRIVITGAIHLDFLRSEYKGYYVDKSTLCRRYGIDASKPLIMFVSSFANLSEEQIKHVLLQYKEEEERELREKYYKAEKETFSIIIKWIIDYAESNECTFIYRPHPVEAKSKQIEELKKYKRIRVIGEENIKQWIICCDQIYSWLSTSTVEMYFAKKPFEILRPIDLLPESDYQIFQDVKFVKDQESFEQLCKGKIYENTTPCMNENIMRSFYDFTEIPSVIRITDFLSTLDQYEAFPWNKIGIKRKVRFVQLCAKQVIEKCKIKCMHVIRKFDILSGSNIRERIDRSLDWRQQDKKDKQRNIITKEEFESIKMKIDKFILKENEWINIRNL